MGGSAVEAENNTDFVFVELPIPFVRGLLALTHLMDERVSGSLRTAIEAHDKTSIESEQHNQPSPMHNKDSIHVAEVSSRVAEILGQRVLGATLPEMFARCIDLIEERDPCAVNRLAQRKTHARRYVARERESIHFKSPHLNPQTIQTKSGWWVSTNVSEPQVTRALSHLARAANLKFGEDIIFPAGTL